MEWDCLADRSADTPRGMVVTRRRAEEVLMCRRVTCSRCGKASYAGCGQHVEQVLVGVPTAQRCACQHEPGGLAGALRRLFGRG